MTESQIQLQTALTTTFLANLAFLSEYDNELYHRVDELSRMIEKGTYEEKYILEFIVESGDFDVFDVINDKYLYDKTPKKINNDLVQRVQFDEKYNIYFIEEYFAIKNKLKVNIDNRFDTQNFEDLIYLTQNDMFEYSNILNDFLDKRNKKIKKIEKFVFLGTLLGRHIPRIAEKVNASMYLVCERNLEIFRLSLFTVDYTILAEKGVIFSIMDNYLEEEKKIRNFIKTSLFENYMIKYSSSGINIDEYIDDINANLVIVNNAAQYVYNRYLYTYVNRATTYLKNKYNILIMPNIKNNLNFFENIPVLYIAAGPSLDENIEWIKNNQNKFYIVTVGAAYKKLVEYDIKIDMISSLDEKMEIANIQFKDEYLSKIDENTIFLASIMTSEKVIKKFNQNNIFLFEVFSPFYKDNEVIEGYSVGEITLGILLKMNIKEIYLIGLDLSLNQNTGLTHSDSSASIIDRYNLTEEQNKEIFSVRKGIIKVKGNQRKEVNTISIFYNSIKAMEEILNENNTKTKIYNLSSHGAYFENSISLNLKDIKINNFKDLNYDNKILINSLKQYSKKDLDTDTQIYFKEDIQKVNEIIEVNLFNLENENINTYDELYKCIINLYLSINVNNKIILIIVKNYLMILLPYLSYHFNDKKINNESKKVKKIKETFLLQTKKLLEDYKLCLKRIC